LVGFGVGGGHSSKKTWPGEDWNVRQRKKEKFPEGTSIGIPKRTFGEVKLSTSFNYREDGWGMQGEGGGML